jgi:diacylglycerol kinase family enzyme
MIATPAPSDDEMSAPCPAPAAHGARLVGAVGRGALLLNPRSGGGKVRRFGLEDEALRRGITPIVLGPGGDLRALAEEAVAAGVDALGVAGGDGSQAPVADVARRHGVPLVCVPAGTRNHFARDLGVDRDDVVAALDAFGAAVERPVDLAAVGDRVFVNNASLGLYASVVRTEAYRHAPVRTALDVVSALLGPGTPPSDLRFVRPDGVRECAAHAVVVSNNAYRLGALRGFGTRLRLDGRVLGIVTLRLERRRDLLRLLTANARGTVQPFAGLHEWTAPEFVVESDAPLVELGLDGEAQSVEPPLRFRSLPAALLVRTPHQAMPTSAFACRAERSGVARARLADRRGQ